MGGVIDGNYGGRLKVILLNTSSTPITIPLYVPFSHSLLMVWLFRQLKDGPVYTSTTRGADVAVSPSELFHQRAGKLEAESLRLSCNRSLNSFQLIISAICVLHFLELSLYTPSKTNRWFTFTS